MILKDFSGYIVEIFGLKKLEIMENLEREKGEVW